MIKRIAVIIVYVIITAMLCGHIAYGKEFGVVNGIKNAFQEWLIGGFLEGRGILSNHENASNVVEEFLTAAQNNDINAMMSLFAPAAVSEIGEEELKKMLTSFVDYYDGEWITVTERFGAATDENSYEGKKSKEIRAPFEIVTTSKEYRLAAKIVLIDEWQSENVGLWSVYILDRAKDSNVDQPYRGDLNYRTGVYVDIARPR